MNVGAASCESDQLHTSNLRDELFPQGDSVAAAVDQRRVADIVLYQCLNGDRSLFDLSYISVLGAYSWESDQCS